METQQAEDALDEVLVERDDRGERPAGRRIAQPQPMLAGRVSDDDMPAVDSGLVGEQRAQRQRIDRLGAGISFRRQRRGSR
nr:hypothetical protein [Sphingomonas koreensis]